MPGMTIGPQPGATQIVGSASLPANPTFRQIYVTPSGLYICLTDGSWQLLEAGGIGNVTGGGTTNTIPKWTNGAGSVIGDSLLTDNHTTLTYTGSGGIKGAIFTSAAANPADSGAVRLGNTETIAWETATPGTDLTLGVNSTDQLVTNAATVVNNNFDLSFDQNAESHCFVSNPNAGASAMMRFRVRGDAPIMDFLAQSTAAGGTIQMQAQGNAAVIFNQVSNAPITFQTNNTQRGGFSAGGTFVAQGPFNYAADAGSTDTYAITLPIAPAAYVAGMYIAFKANTANTGACSVNVNGLGDVALKRGVSTDPGDNFIKANSIVVAIFDGTNFQLVTPAAQ